jgi:hypothetical protein
MPEQKDNQTQEAITAMVLQDFGLAADQAADEEQLLAVVAARVGDLMAHDMDFLLGMLYRLDVLEEKIKPALNSGIEAPHIALARLIIERQKQRYKSKLNSFKPLPDDMQDLAW